MLVDDAPDLREVYRIALEDEGYEVREAPAAEQALAVAHDWRPDLVLTDIFMPGMGGFELITRMRSDFAPPVPVIVALSGFPDARGEALRRGAVCFSVKPLSLTELVELVDGALSAGPHSGPPEEASDSKDSKAERRTAARNVSQAMVEAFLARTPDSLERMNRGMSLLSRFFGHSTAVVLLLRGGSLTVSASSDPLAYPIGDEASDLLSLGNDVLDSTSTIVLPTRHAQALLRRASRTVRFFVSTPYVIQRRAVGALCLLGDTSHDFPSCELGVLEYVAARSSAQMSDPVERPMMGRSGLLSRDAFETLLGFTLEWASHGDMAMGITLLAPTAPPRDGSCAEIIPGLPGPRMSVGLLDRHRIAAFSAAPTLSVVRERLLAVRASVGARLEVGASAELTFEAPIPRLAADLLLKWAGDVLVRAKASPSSACLGVSTRWTQPTSSVAPSPHV